MLTSRPQPGHSVENFSGADGGSAESDFCFDSGADPAVPVEARSLSSTGGRFASILVSTPQCGQATAKPSASAGNSIWPPQEVQAPLVNGFASDMGCASDEPPAQVIQ